MSVVTVTPSSQKRKNELKFLRDLYLVANTMVQNPTNYTKKQFEDTHESVTNCLYNVYNLIKMKCDRYSIDNFRLLTKFKTTKEVEQFLEPFGIFAYKPYYIAWYRLKKVQPKLTKQINAYKSIDLQFEGFRSLFDRALHIQNKIDTDEYTKNFIIDLNKFLMQIESQI